MLRRTDEETIPFKRIDNIEISIPHHIEEPSNFCCIFCFYFSKWMYKQSSTPKTPKGYRSSFDDEIFGKNRFDVPPPTLGQEILSADESEHEPKSCFCFCCFYFSKWFTGASKHVPVDHHEIIESEIKFLPNIMVNNEPIKPTQKKSTVEIVRDEMKELDLNSVDNMLFTEYSQTPLSPLSLNSHFSGEFHSDNMLTPDSEEIDHPDILKMMQKKF
jgi:hypothetical protein